MNTNDYLLSTEACTFFILILLIQVEIRFIIKVEFISISNWKPDKKRSEERNEFMVLKINENRYWNSDWVSDWKEMLHIVLYRCVNGQRSIH